MDHNEIQIYCEMLGCGRVNTYMHITGLWLGQQLTLGSCVAISQKVKASESVARISKTIRTNFEDHVLPAAN